MMQAGELTSEVDQRRLKARLAYARRTAELRRQIVLSEDAFDALVPAAAARGMTVRDLASHLLTVITDDELIDPILDDRAGD